MECETDITSRTRRTDHRSDLTISCHPTPWNSANSIIDPLSKTLVCISGCIRRFHDPIVSPRMDGANRHNFVFQRTRDVRHHHQLKWGNMNNSDFENTAKAWQFVEKDSISLENDILKDMRRRGADAGFPQGSASQARFLNLEAQAVHAESIILVGTGSLVEVEQLIEALGGKGILTVVDSTAKGADIIRATFNRLQDRVKTKLRVVNVAVNEYLSKLNADDYDVIVVAGDETNYQPAYDSAARLLHKGGLLLMTDALALHRNPDGGLTNPADRSDKAVTLRTLLEALRDDENFATSLTNIGTGLAVALRK